MDPRKKLYKADLAQKDNPENLPYYIEYIYTNGLTILDIGCACGDVGILLKKYKQSYNYGLEYNQQAVEIALSTNAYEEVYQADLDLFDINSHPHFINKFDIIFGGDILEHLRKPVNTLLKLKNYLNQNGFFIFSLPNVGHMNVKANLMLNNFTYTPTGLLDETHIHFFTYKTIIQMLVDANLEIAKRSVTVGDRLAGTDYDPFKHLDKELARFIMSDWHSYVTQYIIQAQPSTKNKKELKEWNAAFFDFNNISPSPYLQKLRDDWYSELFND